MQEYLVQLASKGQEIENKKLTIDQGKKEMRNFTKSFFSQKFKENKVSFLKEKLTINYVKNDEKWRLSANENKDLIKLFSLGVVNE